MKQWPCWCPKLVLWELNSFRMQMLSFVSINLQRCWPHAWKHSVDLEMVFFTFRCVYRCSLYVWIFSYMKWCGSDRRTMDVSSLHYNYVNMLMGKLGRHHKRVPLAAAISSSPDMNDIQCVCEVNHTSRVTSLTLFKHYCRFFYVPFDFTWMKEGCMRQSQQFNTTAQWSTACVVAGYVSQELDKEQSGCSPSRLSATQAKEWSFHFSQRQKVL